MEQTKKPLIRRKIFYVTVLIVGLTISIMYLWIFLHTPPSSSSEVKITRFQRSSRAIVVNSIQYWDFLFYVDVLNSGTSDVSGLKLVLDLRVDGNTVASVNEAVGTLRASWESTNNLLALNAVDSSQLFDDHGNYRGTIEAFITLYSGNEVLDQTVSGVF